jgi:hypothetical protein
MRLMNDVSGNFRSARLRVSDPVGDAFKRDRIASLEPTQQRSNLRASAYIRPEVSRFQSCAPSRLNAGRQQALERAVPGEPPAQAAAVRSR